jgi:hypothetical protein
VLEFRAAGIPELCVAILIGIAAAPVRAAEPATNAKRESATSAASGTSATETSGGNAAPADGGTAGDEAGEEGAVIGEEAGNEVAAGEEPESGDEDEADQPLWMESYGEGVFSRHDDRNLSGFAEYKIGKRFHAGVPVDVYLKTRLYRDQRDFYWNNRVDGGAGARVSLLKKVSLTVFGEVVGGQYLRLSSGTVAFDGLQTRIDRNRTAIDGAQKDFQAMYKEIFQAHLLGDDAVNRQAIAHLDTTGSALLGSLARLNSRLDSLETSKDSLNQVMDSLGLIPAGPLTEYRAGLVFWHGWGADGGGEAEGGSAARFRFPLRFWGEIYSEWIFSSLSRHVRTRGGGETYRDSVARFRNLIFYANPDVGAMVMEGLAGSLSAYGTAYVWFDTRKDWWNNLAMAGPGLRYKPLGMLDLVFKAEYLWGRYYGRERKEDPNPYARNLKDLRITGSFWYGLGT